MPLKLPISPLDVRPSPEHTLLLLAALALDGVLDAAGRARARFAGYKAPSQRLPIIQS